MDFSSLPVDSSGQYHIQRSFLKPRLRSQKGWQDVTMVTHCTVNHLHYLLDLSEHWQGPIAVGKCGISISNSLKGNIKLTASLCSYIVLKPCSHIVFDGSTVLQYPRTTIWKHLDQILNTGKYTFNTIKYWVLQIGLVSIHNTVKYPQRPSATVGNHIGMHHIPLDTFGNPEYSNYLLFKRFLRRTRSSNKRWRPQTICSRESIEFIGTNPAKIQIYRQLLLATQIPSNTQIFDGIWVANIKYRILSNTAKYYMGTR